MKAAVLGEGNGAGAGAGGVVERGRDGGAGGQRSDKEAAPAKGVRAVKRLEVDGVRLEIHSSPPSWRPVPLLVQTRVATLFLSRGAVGR